MLAIFLPVAMVWVQRAQQTNEQGYQVRGGRFGLSLAACCGVVIIAAQGLQMFGVIPALG